MQALVLRANLAGISLINASIPCSRLPERITLSATRTRPAASYNCSRSIHARQEEPFDSESAMEAQKKPDAEAGLKTSHSDRNDMADSFGDGYSTRASDEGFGERYEEHVKYDQDQTPSQGLGFSADRREQESDTKVGHGYDQSQGSEVREKEMARHATQHTAFSAHNRPTPGGIGGTAT